MKGIYLIIAALFLSLGLGAQVLSCYDVQYTADPDGNSPYMDQSVTVGGIVTAVKANSNLYIGNSQGGPWSGLYIYDRNVSNVVSVGDSIVVTGTVSEYKQGDYWAYALTELVSVSSYTIVSSNNPVPAATPVTTAQVAFNSVASEQWEGVLVRLTDVQIKTAPDSYGQFKVADAASGNIQAMIDDGFFSIAASYQIVVNDWWYVIQGVVDYHGSSSAGWKLNPRTPEDLVKIDSVESSRISIPNVNGTINSQINVPLTTSKIKMDWGVQSYTVSFKIDPAQVRFQDLSIAGTLTPVEPVPTISAMGDTISFSVTYPEMLIAAEGDTLINLVMEPLSYGNATITLLSFKYDNININNLVGGSIQTKIRQSIAYLNIGNSLNKKNIFNPSNNEKINIQYGCKTGILGKALVRIYDAKGRLVATPVNLNLPNANAALSIDTFAWNGRDANLNLLPPGLYYCHLEVTDRSSGKSERTVQPIVIKARLK